MILTPRALQTAIKELEKVLSPRIDTPLSKTTRVWQDAQSTACSIAVMMSSTMLAYATKHKDARNTSLVSSNIVEVVDEVERSDCSGI